MVFDCPGIAAKYRLGFRFGRRPPLSYRSTTGSGMVNGSEADLLISRPFNRFNIGSATGQRSLGDDVLNDRLLYGFSNWFDNRFSNWA